MCWLPISEYKKPEEVICCHKEKRWIRFGRQLSGHGMRWYYSGTNERSQYAQVEGDEPTHFQPIPKLPLIED